MSARNRKRRKLLRALRRHGVTDLGFKDGLPTELPTDWTGFPAAVVDNLKGHMGVSGNAACRWYINEDLPNICDFRNRLCDNITAIQHISLLGQTAAEVDAQVNLETKTVRELADLDMFDNRDSRFLCTAVLSRLAPSQRWWFSSCTTCYKSSLPDGAAYRCSDPACAGIDAIPRYRICYVARDDDAEVNEPGEAEFVFFDRVGRELLGAPLISILCHGRSPVAPLLEIVQSACGDPVIPRELSAVISRKFHFVVSISSKCFTSDDDDELSFQVLRIDTPLGKQPQPSVAYRASSVTTGTTSSASLPNDSPPPTRVPGASSSSLPPGSSTPPPSIANTPEALLPALSSPPSVTKPSVTGSAASEVKPKPQRVLFKDKAPVSATPVISDPIDSDLVDANDDNLGCGSVTEQERLSQFGASTVKDDLPLPDPTSDAKRSHPSVPPMLEAIPASWARISKNIAW